MKTLAELGEEAYRNWKRLEAEAAEAHKHYQMYARVASTIANLGGYPKVGDDA